jgi:hypothetical protein
MGPEPLERVTKRSGVRRTGSDQHDRDVTEARSTRRSWGFLLLLAVAVGVYAGAVTEALLGLFRREPWNWAAMAGRAVGPAIGWVLVYALQNVGLFPTREARQRREGNPGTMTAIATGVLPSDADPRRWHWWLELDRREPNQVRWAILALWVPGGVLVAAAAAIPNDNAWGVWLLAVALLALTLLLVRRLTRRIGTADRLLDELGRR